MYRFGKSYYLKMKKYIYLIALVLFIFASCEKDKRSPEEVKWALLTDKPWKLKMKTMKAPSGVTVTNGVTGISNLSPCEEDNLYIFSTSNRLTIKYGASKCTDEAGDERTEDYQFDPETNKISMKGFSVVLDELSKNTLQYHLPIPFTTGSVDIFYIYEH